MTEESSKLESATNKAHTVLERNGKIRIVIADDHPIFLDGLKRVLKQEEKFAVVGEARDGRETLELVQQEQPDILLLDLRMPVVDGMEVLQQLQRMNLPTRVIVLTAAEDKMEYVQAMRYGACGIVLKQTPGDLIVKSVRKVASGEIWLDSHTTAAVMQQFAAPAEHAAATPSAAMRNRERSPLSAREREIVALVAQGYKNKEMAEKMFISEQTVKNHLHNIFDKLGVSDRLELALYAIHKGYHVYPVAER